MPDVTLTDAMCEKPDRDAPKLRCGYPLPCPWHTMIVSETAIYEPEGLNLSPRTRRRVLTAADAILARFAEKHDRVIVGEEDAYDA